MNKRSNNEIGGSSPIQAVPEDLLEARETFVLLFKDSTPLINSGYTHIQLAKTIPVLRKLEQPGKFFPESSSTLQFGEILGGAIIIRRLRDQGYALDANDFKPRWPKYFPKAPYSLAQIKTLPMESISEDVDELVKNLYLSSTWRRIEPSSIANRLISPLRPKVGIFKAGWSDERTKLELVVESDFHYKTFEISGGSAPPFVSRSQIDVWRRLNPVENNNHLWVPFGRKPDIAQEKYRQMLRESKSKTIEGKLALGIMPQ